MTVICDTPPWSLFVDAKIISQKFGHIIYVAGSEITTFKNIEKVRDSRLFLRKTIVFIVVIIII